MVAGIHLLYEEEVEQIVNEQILKAFDQCKDLAQRDPSLSAFEIFDMFQSTNATDFEVSQPVNNFDLKPTENFQENEVDEVEPLALVEDQGVSELEVVEEEKQPEEIEQTIPAVVFEEEKEPEEYTVIIPLSEEVTSVQEKEEIIPDEIIEVVAEEETTVVPEEEHTIEPEEEKIYAVLLDEEVSTTDDEEHVHFFEEEEEKVAPVEKKKNEEEDLIHILIGNNSPKEENFFGSEDQLDEEDSKLLSDDVAPLPAAIVEQYHEVVAEEQVENEHEVAPVVEILPEQDTKTYAYVEVKDEDKVENSYYLPVSNSSMVKHDEDQEITDVAEDQEVEEVQQVEEVQEVVNVSVEEPEEERPETAHEEIRDRKAPRQIVTNDWGFFQEVSPDEDTSRTSHPKKRVILGDIEE